MKITKIWTTICAAMFFTSCLFLLPIQTEAADLMLSCCGIYDEADVLTPEQETELNTLIADTAETIDMNVFVCLGAEALSGQSDAQKRAKSYYITQFDDDTDSDGIVLYLDLYGTYIDSSSYAPHDYIVTHGIAQLYYTNEKSDNRIQQIFNEMNPHMKRGNEDPYTAVQIFCENLESYYIQGIPNNYYVYDDTTHQYLYLDKTNTPIWTKQKPPFLKRRSYTIAFGISFVVGLLIALVVLISTRFRYQFKSKPNAALYIKRDQIQHLERHDQFLHTHRTRTKIESSSSSDGGGGGGHSSGGFGGGGNSR